jgi:hypothetical protein
MSIKITVVYFEGDTRSRMVSVDSTQDAWKIIDRDYPNCCVKRYEIEVVND